MDVAYALIGLDTAGRNPHAEVRLECSSRVHLRGVGSSTTNVSQMQVQGSATGAVRGSQVDLEIGSNRLHPFPCSGHFGVEKTG